MAKQDPIELAKVALDDATLKTANRQILWGWKRDVGPQFRVVYFSGKIDVDGARVTLGRRHFYYKHRLLAGEAEELRDQLAASTGFAAFDPSLGISRAGQGLADLTVTFGRPDAADIDKTTRLQRRRPRRSWKDVEPAIPVREFDPSEVFAADLYVGSGLSYEAGLPTLCDVHDYFGVDSPNGSDFTVGRNDPLLPRLGADPRSVIADFCRVHTMALSAKPTPAMWTIRKLLDQGLVGKVFTDNVDNMLGKVGVPYERTRGSGVFNERHPAKFKSDTLIVIGVAADRRELVKQARGKRMRVIVVNPCAHVAPRVRHLDYLRRNDLFLKITADDFFAQAIGGRALRGKAA